MTTPTKPMESDSDCLWEIANLFEGYRYSDLSPLEKAVYDLMEKRSEVGETCYVWLNAGRHKHLPADQIHTCD